MYSKSKSPLDRPLSNAEAFSLLILSLTFLGCLILVLAFYCLDFVLVTALEDQESHP